MSHPAQDTAISAAAWHGLAPNPFEVELRGDPDDLVWPDLCPNCGREARRRIRVHKVFRRRRGRRGNHLVTAAAEIPFCEPCTAEHERTAPRLSPLRRALTYVATPLLAALIGAGFMTFVLARDSDVFSESVAGISRAVSTGVPPELGMLGWMALVMPLVAPLVVVQSLILMVWTTRYSRLPAQSAITRACDFSDAIDPIIGTRRRIYTIRDRTFAEAFTKANADRVWTEEAALRPRPAWQIALAAAAVAAALYGLLAG